MVVNSGLQWLIMVNWLVVYLPLWKIWLRQVDDYSQLNKKKVPNHQPVMDVVFPQVYTWGSRYPDKRGDPHSDRVELPDGLALGKSRIGHGKMLTLMGVWRILRIPRFHLLTVHPRQGMWLAITILNPVRLVGFGARESFQTTTQLGCVSSVAPRLQWKSGKHT